MRAASLAAEPWVLAVVLLFNVITHTSLAADTCQTLLRPFLYSDLNDGNHHPVLVCSGCCNKHDRPGGHNAHCLPFHRLEAGSPRSRCGPRWLTLRAVRGHLLLSLASGQTAVPTSARHSPCISASTLPVFRGCQSWWFRAHPCELTNTVSSAKAPSRGPGG